MFCAGSRVELNEDVFLSFRRFVLDGGVEVELLAASLLSTNNRLTVDLPLAAGPSIVTTNFSLLTNSAFYKDDSFLNSPRTSERAAIAAWFSSGNPTLIRR